jgi:aromatic amino acid aminotransferase I
MTTFGTGLPHPSLFPLQKATFTCDAPPTSLTPKDGSNNTELTDLVIGRGSDPGHLELTQFLQYGMSPLSILLQLENKTSSSL